MSSIDVPAAGAALTGNTTALGVATVGDTTPFYPGAEAWLSKGAAQQKVLIVEILSATTMQLRPLNEAGSNVNQLSYGYGDLSAYTTAASSRIDMPGQCVRIDYAYTKHTVS